jgi:4-hydroxy-3-polyprenylbenzoate decarboxylase
MGKRIVVGISGATGAMYGVRALEVLRADPDVETHLIITDAGALTIEEETDWSVADVVALADRVYDVHDIGARISSGSFLHDGMLIAPCSIKSMSMIANSINSSLLVRAADVTLKERRRLVLVVRETPLHLGHLRLLVSLAEVGAVILPPMPCFYQRPETLEEIIDHTVGRILDQLGIQHQLLRRWTGTDPTRRLSLEEE